MIWDADIEWRTCKDVLILIVEGGGVGQEGDWRVVVMSKGAKSLDECINNIIIYRTGSMIAL